MLYAFSFVVKPFWILASDSSSLSNIIGSLSLFENVAEILCIKEVKRMLQSLAAPIQAQVCFQNKVAMGAK